MSCVQNNKGHVTVSVHRVCKTETKTEKKLKLIERWQCNMLCTSGFVNGSIFHIIERMSQSKRRDMFRPVRQVVVPVAKSAVSDCILFRLRVAFRFDKITFMHSLALASVLVCALIQLMNIDTCLVPYKINI